MGSFRVHIIYLGSRHNVIKNMRVIANKKLGHKIDVILSPSLEYTIALSPRRIFHKLLQSSVNKRRMIYYEPYNVGS